ncbi:MAG: hypothetical protein AABW58_02935 [Nanoarchaeota archaeon]
MPDWIVHIAIALVISLVFKIKNWKLVILGSVLPDLPRVLLIILTYLDFNEINSFLILEPLHTPFITVLESLAIALIFKNPLQNFLLIYLGVITHLFSDFLQFAGKFGHLMLYPFSYKQFSMGLFYGGHVIYPIIGLIVLIISFYFLKNKKNNLELNKKFYLSIVPLIIILIFMFSTPGKILENNVHGTDFLLNPDKYNNEEVSLYHVKVVSLNAVEEMSHLVKIETKENLKLNSFITVSGIYKDNKIYVNDIFHNTETKLYSSFLGLFIFIFLIFKKND